MTGHNERGLLRLFGRIFPFRHQDETLDALDSTQNSPSMAPSTSQSTSRPAKSKTSKSKRTLASGTEVETVTVSPLREPHLHTFIILHGRGDTADNFGALLLLMSIAQYQSLRNAFPHARFVFPSAPLRAAAQLGYKRKEPQWYDLWSLRYPEQKEELMKEGLNESVLWVHEMLKEESAEVGGFKNVVLGGLSHGCATSLISMLLWEGSEVPACMFGMCGWLPYQIRMVSALQGRKLGPEEQPDGAMNKETLPTGEEYSQDVRLAALQSIREQIDIPSNPNSSNNFAYQQVPFFLAHGLSDLVVIPDLGRYARETLRKMGAKVEWHEYPTLAHWYSSAMLEKVVEFVKKNLKVPQDVTIDSEQNIELQRKKSPSEVAAEESGEIL